MKINILFILFLGVFSYILPAQEVHWADTLYDFSSELKHGDNPSAFKARTILGRPNAMPGTDNYHNMAWTPAEENGGVEYIDVGFSQPVKASQIIIVENTNPGAIKKIELYDRNNVRIMQLSERKGFKHDNISKPLILPFTQTNKPVKRIVIIMNTGLVQGWNQIDAVGISENIFPYEVKINLVSNEQPKFQKEHLPVTVNSRADELLPQITPDGKTLYFTRENHPRNYGYYNGRSSQDIWKSEVASNGKFTNAVKLPKPINNEYHNSLCSITPDGQKALLMNAYLPNGRMEKGLSIAVKEGNNWGYPKKIEIDKYYNNNKFGEYYLSVSGRILLMAIERQDTYGGKDVYVSFLKTNGRWAEPKNLGGMVNTPCSEVSPFLAADEKTLYYSTSCFLGYGSHDIFVTRRLDDSWTNWSEPQNLGSAINSKGFDAYYSITASGEYAYFSSTNQHNRSSDIYRIRLQEEAKPKPVVLVKGHVYDKKTKKPIAAQILYESLTSGKEIGEARSKSDDGFYSIVLTAGEKYGFRANAKGYAAINRNIDLTKLDSYREIERDLYLVPIEKGQTVRLNNVFFEYDKTEIVVDTHLELDRLVKLMQEYPSMKIEIGGHTDNKGSASYNRRLSTKRAKAVYDYLINKGINKKRLSYKGYGKSKPIESNDTEEGRKANRRVEFKIIKL
jgi:outer membrane protein OmpA-like peptidoglycan-associated protein